MGTAILIERDSVLKPLTRPGFWRRQFAARVTLLQIAFDAVFGIVGPILCFAFDPLVFRGDIVAGPLFPQYRDTVYLFTGLEILMLSFWLLATRARARPALQLWRDLWGTALLAGGIFCFAAGLVLLPFSLMGLIIGIGIFGFTPFLTGIVYLRNGSRALQNPRTDSTIPTRALTFGLSAVIVIGAPILLGFAIHQAIENSVNEIVHGDATHAAAAAHRIAPLKYFVGVESDQIVTAYLQTAEPMRKQILKECYQEITGEDIEARIKIRRD